MLMLLKMIQLVIDTHHTDTFNEGDVAVSMRLGQRHFRQPLLLSPQDHFCIPFGTARLLQLVQKPLPSIAQETELAWNNSQCSGHVRRQVQ